MISHSVITWFVVGFIASLIERFSKPVCKMPIYAYLFYTAGGYITFLFIFIVEVIPGVWEKFLDLLSVEI
jgi:hypothetical protein